jgi:methylphosphotriester-DNA--protein-cysteine methyltransferase
MIESKRLALIGRAATDTEWAAIAARRSQPRFLFIVTSTGIICTLGCPARGPGCDRVQVIGGMAERLADGARARRGCHPDRAVGAGGAVGAVGTGGAGGAGGADPTPAVDPVAATITRLTASLSADEDVPTDRLLAGELGLPERRLREVFRDSLGVTPRAWVAARRTEMLCSRLAGRPGCNRGAMRRRLRLLECGLRSRGQRAGHGSGSFPRRRRGRVHPLDDHPDTRWSGPGRRHCARSLRRPAGGRYRRAGCGTAAAELRLEFPRMALARDDASLADLAGLVSDLAVGRRRPDADTLPLDVHATAFRRRV